ncbi:MAG: UDP-N-acetylmuramate dehydrogenase [Spirochaetaceae bacterium]|nr:MAG: UDP-N-acetylmuramate dehydrogenase [Spirochaetaceae bacterium]
MEKFKPDCPVEYGTPLAPYTTFRVGGPAEVLAHPRNVEELARLVRFQKEAGVPLTVLGGGANVVVSDRGIRGLVVHTGKLHGIRHEGTTLYVAAGTPISEAAAYAADHDLGGLAFIYAMPGSTGGAIWMNARCYDGEIAPILEKTRYLSLEEHDFCTVGTYQTRREEFGYKISPFQRGTRVILEATFRLTPGRRSLLWEEMRDHEEDRRRKGHFLAPCAGSIFKNNRAFGAPSGRIIDQLGLRGRQHGGARVSDLHGNIIVNHGNATAREIRELVEYVQQQVELERGIRLEPEILFLGEWDR